jgi:hypothetical protein
MNYRFPDDSPAPFIIFALPRSRTRWLATFLSYGQWRCHHDIVTDIHTVEGLKEFFSRSYIGTAETGMVEGWRLAQALMPDARRVVVRRSVADVKNSLAKFGIEWNADLERRNKLLDEVSERPNVLTVAFEDLDDEHTCKRIFEYCLGIGFDRNWWLMLKDANIQIDMQKRLQKLADNRAAIDALKVEAARMVA